VTDSYGVSNVWCVITAPDYAGQDDLPETNLVRNPLLNRYEAVYTNFPAQGTYTVTFYARNDLGELAMPRQVLLTMGDGDEYEPDDTALQPSFYAVGETNAAQRHTFHVEGDEDWICFYATRTVFEIRATQLGENSDVAMEVWYRQADGTLTNIYGVEQGGDLSGPGIGESEVTTLDLVGQPALPEGFYFVRVTSGFWGNDSDYEFRVSVSQGGAKLFVVACDVLHSSMPPTGAVAIIDGMTTQAFGTATSLAVDMPTGTHAVVVLTGSGYLPVWDYALPAQEMNPASFWYGNPKAVAVTDESVKFAIFQFMPVFRVGGTVRDAMMSNGVEGARLAFTARSGVLSNTVYDGYPGQASYRTIWVTGPDGAFPANVWLPTVNWDLTLSRPGYPDLVVPGAILNAQRGAETNTGVFSLTPNLTLNGVPEWWLMKYGWTNDFAAAATNDTDGDGQPTWMEWMSDTDPTNPASALRILSFASGTNGMRIGWQGGSAVSQYLERSSGLGTGGFWLAVFTNPPPTAVATNALDAPATNKTLFYRIRTTR
jgi:hypothetical protein